MPDRLRSHKEFELHGLLGLGRALQEHYSQSGQEELIEALNATMHFLAHSRKPPIIRTSKDLDRWVKALARPVRRPTQETHGEPLTRETQYEPPCAAEKLILLLAPKSVREALPGDLEEEFHSIAAKYGGQFARRWYWAQVALSSWPMIRLHILNWLGLSIGVKLVEWVTRRLGR